MTLTGSNRYQLSVEPRKPEAKSTYCVIPFTFSAKTGKTHLEVREVREER